MGTAAKPIRENRTITVDFQSEATYFQITILLDDGDGVLDAQETILAVPGLAITGEDDEGEDNDEDDDEDDDDDDDDEDD